MHEAQAAGRGHPSTRRGPAPRRDRRRGRDTRAKRPSAELTARWLALREAESTPRCGAMATASSSLAVALAERPRRRRARARARAHRDPRARRPRRGAGGAARGHPRPPARRGRAATAAHRRDGLDLAVDRRRERRGACARCASAAHRPGNIDAQLAPRLERLAAALRDALRVATAPPPRCRLRPALPVRSPGGRTPGSSWRPSRAASSRQLGTLERAATRRDAARRPVHRRAPRHPPRARVRALHRRAHPQGRRVASLLHPAADPLALRDDGRRHPHAIGHPDAPRAARHRRRRPARRAWRSPSRSTRGGRPTRRSSRSTTARRRTSARRLAPPAAARSLLRAAHVPTGMDVDALARRLRGLGGDVRDDDQPAPRRAARRRARRVRALRPAAEPHRAVGAPLDAGLLLRERRQLRRARRPRRAAVSITWGAT